MSASHDTSAVICDGKLVAAINEERLTRVKRKVGAPLHAVPAVLECVTPQARSTRSPCRADHDRRYARKQRLSLKTAASACATGRRDDGCFFRAGRRSCARRWRSGPIALMPHVPQARPDPRPASQPEGQARGHRRPSPLRSPRRPHRRLLRKRRPDCLIVPTMPSAMVCAQGRDRQAGRFSVISRIRSPIRSAVTTATQPRSADFRSASRRRDGPCRFRRCGKTIGCSAACSADEARGQYVNHGPIFGRALRTDAHRLAELHANYCRRHPAHAGRWSR